ncbi:MAG TPA: hypothetical protein VKU44_01865, partial [Terriglobia bacterium]|nr:hypothetical protein [Terriglobia bacterium]
RKILDAASPFLERIAQTTDTAALVPLLDGLAAPMTYTLVIQKHAIESGATGTSPWRGSSA